MARLDGRSAVPNVNCTRKRQRVARMHGQRCVDLLMQASWPGHEQRVAFP